MLRLCKVSLIIAVFFTLPAGAAERILLPVAIEGEVAGAFGSRWISELVLTNTGSAPITLDGIDSGCRIPPCMAPVLPARATIYPRPGPVVTGIPAILLHIGEGDPAALAIQLRVQDVSRQSQTWGTEVPVVWERDAFTSVLHLQDVPFRPEFRQLLRVYGFAPEGAVRVRVYRIDPTVRFPDRARPDEILSERTLSLRSSWAHPQAPAYADLDLGELAVGDATRVRLEIEKATEGLRFWAMVSVTNNETQHVTLITPDHPNP